MDELFSMEDKIHTSCGKGGNVLRTLIACACVSGILGIKKNSRTPLELPFFYFFLNNFLNIKLKKR